MRTSELEYELPAELIARHPTERRDGGRLLVLGREGLQHRAVRELSLLVPEGALVVVNDTRVLPARLSGKKESGGKVELLLVRCTGGRRWRAMGRATHPIREGMRLSFGQVSARVLERPDDDGLLLVELEAEDLDAALAAVGRVPLPPYLEREEEPADRERYQTLFAREPGAVAAPTAGLHFSPELIAAVRERAEICAITLHVGPGTFRPVKAADLDEHRMHGEELVIGEAAAEQMAAARRRNAPIVAVGTTVVRALESAAGDDGVVRALRGETRLLIQPGYRFKVVDALLTNFHLPGSTLLALVCAFAGTGRVLAAYREAVAERYRFYSYGDAMWLPARAS